MNEIKWATCIPLVGGMSIGNSLATGNKPVALFSLPGFQAHDASLQKYWPDVGYHVVEEGFKVKKCWKNLDFVSTVCPCAGLSMLNTSTGKNGKSRGGDAVQNEWMYKTARFVLEKLKPKVFWGENAPALMSSIGAPVLEQFKQIATDNGYSFSAIKTNTKLHGIPQNRSRSFYFFWKSPTAPHLSMYDREYKKIGEFLKDVDRSSKYFNFEEAEGKLKDSEFYKFVLEKLGKNYRDKIKELGYKSFFNYLVGEDLLLACKEHIQAKEESKSTERALRQIGLMESKFADGKGYWDWSPHVYTDYVNAVISKNMPNTLHPTEERILTVKEYMMLMGLPDDFELDNDSAINHICQNVPVNTARDWTYEVIKFLNGQLNFSNETFLKEVNKPTKIKVDSGFSEFITSAIA